MVIEGNPTKVLGYYLVPLGMSYTNRIPHGGYAAVIDFVQWESTPTPFPVII